MKELSVFAAKTHFSGVISDVFEHHQTFIITKRGQKVARIVPYEAETKKDVENIIKAMDLLAQKIGKTGVTLDDILKMRDEGRR